MTLLLGIIIGLLNAIILIVLYQKVPHLPTIKKLISNQKAEIVQMENPLDNIEL